MRNTRTRTKITATRNDTVFSLSLTAWVTTYVIPNTEKPIKVEIKPSASWSWGTHHSQRSGGAKPWNHKSLADDHPKQNSERKIQPIYLPFPWQHSKSVKSRAMFKMVNFCDISIKREPQINQEWPEVMLKYSYLITPRQTANSHLASCVVSEVSFRRIAPQRRKLLTSQSSKTAAARRKKKGDIPLLPETTATRKQRGREENPRRISARRKPEFSLQFRLFRSIFGGGAV